MKLALLSDVHGDLPPRLPDNVDVVCLAGDNLPLWAPNSPNAKQLIRQGVWVKSQLYGWMEWLVESGQTKNVVYTWGNHDWVAQYDHEKGDILPPPPTGCYNLVDSGVEIDGVKFWGTPWQPVFFDWAFNLSEPGLAEKFALIPLDTDVLISHGPPFGYGDIIGRTHVGSTALTSRIKIVEPKIVVCGHVHVGAGSYELTGNNGNTIDVYNCSVKNENYKVVREPVIVEI